MGENTVVILGGGITALATAIYLDRAGIRDYVILERGLEPGGLCRSVFKDGFVWDYTGHVLWRADPETRQFFDDVMGDNQVSVARKAAVWTHGKMVPYPFQAHLKYLPPEVAYECLHGFLHRDRYLKGVDFESWSLAMFGEGIHKHFMLPFNEKLFTLPLREMTSDWCQDVPVPTLEQILRGTIIGETFALKGNSNFIYPKVGGMQSLVDELVRRVGPERIMTGRKVCEIDVEKKVVTHVDFAGNKNQISYKQVVSTIPFRQFLKYFVPQDGKLREFSQQLRTNNVACVMVGFERPLTDLHWLYVPERKYAFYRVGFTNNLTESVAPQGCGSITSEITITSEMNPTTEELLSATLSGLKDIGLWDESNKVLTSHVEYLAPAYVLYDLARKAVPKLIDGFKEVDVHCVGRFGGWHYTAVSDNIREARLTAKDIVRRLTC